MEKVVWSTIASRRALLGGPEKPRTEEQVIKGKQENRADAREYRTKNGGSFAGEKDGIRGSKLEPSRSRHEIRGYP